MADPDPPASPESLSLYALLGVPRDADAEALKKGYRREARKHHPDKNPLGDAAGERFKRIGSAFKVLSDPAMRERYVRGRREEENEPDSTHCCRVRCTEYGVRCTVCCVRWCAVCGVPHAICCILIQA